MNNFKYYVISWAVLLAAFNAIVFVCAKGNFSSAFWIGYAFISVAFIGQLICAGIALKPENITKKFYNLPIVTESYTGLVLMLIFGSLFMAIPGVPTWPGIIICAAILCLSVITIMQAAANSDMVEAIDKKVADETAFMKNLTKEAEALVAMAKTPEIKAECEKVYEAIRYAPKRSRFDSTTYEDLLAKIEDAKNAVDQNDLNYLAVVVEYLKSVINKT